MRLVFFDTVGFLAVWDKTDQWHSDAHAAFRRLLQEGAALFTTEFVLAECANASSRKPYRHEVNTLREELQRQQRVIMPTPTMVQEAWRRYAGGGPGAPGVVDQLSFLAMRGLGVNEAFTNDRHFKAAGFTTLF